MSNPHAHESSPLLSSGTTVTEVQDQDTESAKMSSAFFWKVGAVFGATAVGFGAFGAHGLKKRIADPAKLANWSTAAHYQVWPLLPNTLKSAACSNPKSYHSSSTLSPFSLPLEIPSLHPSSPQE